MENKFNYTDADIANFDHCMEKYGWIVYEGAVDPEFLEEISNSLENAYQKRREIQLANGIGDVMSGTLHHLVEKELFTLQFLRNGYCAAQIKHFLKGNYILNSLGAVINTNDASRYVQHIHRDIRSYTGDYKLMIQLMVILDDFTLENGATFFLSGSHKAEEKPSEALFFNNADRAVVKKGSIIAFDSNLWHATGKNYTDKPRRTLTMAFTKPFFKPQLDYPRALGYDFGKHLDEELRQVLGYKSRIPQDLNEYYQPVEKRMYQPDQE
ncbi:MAG: phytanoyl-CoA dioxygenase [Pedobacter sp.]|nr:MAG: phytanoyl-CoA dioxygenase [Pedobacter sp.]